MSYFNIIVKKLIKLSLEQQYDEHRHLVRKVIKVTLQRTAKMPEGFPKGKFLRNVDNLVLKEYDVNLLLDWMYEQGYSPMNSKMVAEQRVMFDKFERELYG